MPPRASLRPREATPARSTRAASAAQQETSATRRSTRAASRQPIATKDVVSNPALPEIQTQQSYAYGSSKTPALPEQLRSRTLNMSAVAAHLDDVTNEAERNLQAHATEARGPPSETQPTTQGERAQGRASRQVSRNPSKASPDQNPARARKHNRVADWVQSSSHLDDISEVDSPAQSSSERDREVSLPSSFPDGSFDHSYSYEKGERGPRLPQPKDFRQPHSRSPPRSQPQATQGQRLRSHLESRKMQDGDSPPSRAPGLVLGLRNGVTRLWALSKQIIGGLCSYVLRILRTMQISLAELPDSPVLSMLFKAIFTGIFISTLSFMFCLGFAQYCDSSSTSIVSQTLQSICGTCSASATLPTWNVSDPSDVQQLLDALKQTHTQIAQVESRLNSRISLNHASLSSDASTLRSHQEALELQIRRLSKTQHSLESTSSLGEVTSPLIPRINFFSPANGAVIIPRLTSPTLAQKFFFPIAVGLRALGIRKYLSPPPVTALESWLDEGDCWCAAAPPAKNAGSSRGGGQDSVRLAIQISHEIYPTELVVEHYPATGSLEPGTAPKDIELWADFSKLNFEEWAQLHIQDLIDESPDQSFVPGQSGSQKTWARIGMASYQISTSQEVVGIETHELGADETYGSLRQQSIPAIKSSEAHGQAQNHVQRFNLGINQNGLLHFADRYMVRVTSNHGAPHTCLYRVRLHGQPVQTR